MNEGWIYRDRSPDLAEANLRSIVCRMMTPDMVVKTQMTLLQNRRTKIIATVGPACATLSVLEALIVV